MELKRTLESHSQAKRKERNRSNHPLRSRAELEASEKALFG
jgi:hypothetical protein